MGGHRPHTSLAAEALIRRRCSHPLRTPSRHQARSHISIILFAGRLYNAVLGVAVGSSIRNQLGDVVLRRVTCSVAMARQAAGARPSRGFRNSISTLTGFRRSRP